MEQAGSKLAKEIYYYCGCGHLNRRDIHDVDMEELDEFVERTKNANNSESEDEDPVPDNDDPVIKAIKNDNTNQLISLLGFDGENESDRDGSEKPAYLDPQYALRRAYSLGKLNFVKALHDHVPVDWSQRYKHGDTPLHLASSGNTEHNFELVEYIIEQQQQESHVDNLLEATNDGGKTPLHTAAYAGSLDIIALLLNLGADPCKKDKFNRLPFNLSIPPTKAYKLLKLAAGIGRLEKTRETEPKERKE